ncbi:MAG TPA: hypothetical protein VFX43_19385 [Chitinophagaceae bacterium]|nr:hypothetical protein [Chitinophagaceae bacterium]
MTLKLKIMTKTFLIAAWTATCFVAFLSQSSYASSREKMTDPDPRTTKAIHQDFPQATQIMWKRKGEDFIAIFHMYENKVTATYDNKGKLLSTLILISSESLPFEIRTKLAQKYPDYNVQCAREYMDKQGDNYFFILKKQEGDLINWLSIKSNDRHGFTMLQKLSERAK